MSIGITNRKDIGVVGAAILAVLFPTVLWAQTPSQQVPSQTNPQTPPPNPSAATQANPPNAMANQSPMNQKGTQSVSSLDRQFLIKAAQGNLAEVKSAKLALKKSSDTGVKQVAQRILNDHTKAQQQLTSLARSLSVALPAMPSDTQQATYTKWSKLSGNAFDNSYLSGQMHDHAVTISLFQKEVNSGSNPSVKAWARQTLPTLSGHATHIKQEAQRMGMPMPKGQQSASSHGSAMSQ